MKADAVLYLLICAFFLCAALLTARAIEQSYLAAAGKYEQQYKITEEGRR